MSLTDGSHTPAMGSRRRLKRPSVSAVNSRRRAATPLSQWKFFEDGNIAGGGQFRGARVSLSARTLAAGLWQFRFKDVSGGGGGIGRFKLRPRGRSRSQPVSPPPYPKCSTEGSTKWEPRRSDVSDEVHQFYSQMKLPGDREDASISVFYSLQAEVLRARSRIRELKAEKRSSKKRLKHFLKMVEEQSVSWRRREQMKIHAVVDDLRDELDRERESCHRMEMLNARLLNELSEAKLSAEQFMQDYEEERRGRELMEEVCNELAKQIGEDKTAIDALKRHSMKMRQEVEEERQMLQMAEVWREERVQMKLVDAKLALEDRYSQMNKLVADLETFMQLGSPTLDAMDLRKAELIRQAVKSIDVQDTKEFVYQPPKSDDIFSIYEDIRKVEAKVEEPKPCVNNSPDGHASRPLPPSPNNDASMLKHYDHANGYTEETPGCKRASCAEDQVSSDSLEGSEASINNADLEPPNSELIEVRLLAEGNENGRVFPNRVSGPESGGLRCQDPAAQRGAADTANPHIARGMKGCIEWPRGIQKQTMKPKHLGLGIESQKSQLRLLKQKT